MRKDYADLYAGTYETCFSRHSVCPDCGQLTAYQIGRWRYDRKDKGTRWRHMLCHHCNFTFWHGVVGYPHNKRQIVQEQSPGRTN